LRLAAALALLLLTAWPALAQQRGELFYEDESGQLDRAAVERAARPLLERGVVAVYMVDEGGGESDFIRRLEEDGLKQRGADRLIANMVAVYVSLSPRYSAIRGGDDFNAALGTELGGQTNAEIIRSNELNPGLASGDFTKGFVDALTAIEGAAASPPDPSGGINIDPTPIVLGLLGAGGAAVGAGALVARRRRALALQGARERYTIAQREAGAAIADTGQAIENTAAKAQYDRVSYGADDVARLAAIQQRVTAGFAEAQQLFDQAGERFNQKAKPQIADYDAAATAYKQVGEQVAAVRAQLDEADALRRELDGLAQQAPGEIDRAKKA
jgi:hypothetical protein